MTQAWMVSPGKMAVMGLVGAFTVLLPLALGFWLHRRTGGRRRFFLLGCAVFFLFALVLEQLVHGVVLGGPAGTVLKGNLWLYALYGGLMAGVFEECGRWLAFRAARRDAPELGDALMYGAGHGGFEAMALLGMTMVNDLILSAALNQGGLAAVEGLMGPIPEAGMAALEGMVSAPWQMFLWAGFERVGAILLHISLSVLVWLAATRRGKWCWFPAAIGLHALFDVAAAILNAYTPVAVTELVIFALSVGAALLARHIYLKQKAETT